MKKSVFSYEKVTAAKQMLLRVWRDFFDLDSAPQAKNVWESLLYGDLLLVYIKFSPSTHPATTAEGKKFLKFAHGGEFLFSFDENLHSLMVVIENETKKVQKECWWYLISKHSQFQNRRWKVKNASLKHWVFGRKLNKKCKTSTTRTLEKLQKIFFMDTMQ